MSSRLPDCLDHDVCAQPFGERPHHGHRVRLGVVNRDVGTKLLSGL